jgi:hypothetical protein
MVIKARPGGGKKKKKKKKKQGRVHRPDLAEAEEASRT